MQEADQVISTSCREMPHCSPVDLVVLSLSLPGSEWLANQGPVSEKSYSWQFWVTWRPWNSWLMIGNAQHPSTTGITQDTQTMAIYLQTWVQDSARYCQHVKLCQAVRPLMKLNSWTPPQYTQYTQYTSEPLRSLQELQGRRCPWIPWASLMPMEHFSVSFGAFRLVLAACCSAMLTPCIAMHKDFASLHHLVLL